MGRDYFYAVHQGRSGNRVYRTWAATQLEVRGVHGVRFKKFASEEDARYFAETGQCRPLHVQAPSDILTVHTDGSTSSNGERAGIGVFFGADHRCNLAEPLPHPPATNNRAELWAIHRALDAITEHAESFAPFRMVALHTDSYYAYAACTAWRSTWEATNFRDNTIANRDLVERLWKRIDTFRMQFTLVLHWVKGHAGSTGNEGADALARVGARLGSSRRVKGARSRPASPSNNVHPPASP